MTSWPGSLQQFQLGISRRWDVIAQEFMAAVFLCFWPTSRFTSRLSLLCIIVGWLWLMEGIMAPLPVVGPATLAVAGIANTFFIFMASDAASCLIDGDPSCHRKRGRSRAER
jgi:hypothetical protein